MINKTFYSIFQQGSRTYFYSSLFFPTRVKNDVFVLYGFVRKADNYVDSLPQDKNGFYKFKKRYHLAREGYKTGDIVIDSFAQLAEKKGFEDKWIDAFLESMEMDLQKKTYETIDDTLQYIYGSAEVIGLLMGKVMNLQPASYPYAQHLGRAMQYINFIRDIAEDLELGRIYFPQNDFQKFGLENLEYEYTKKHPNEFFSFIQEQILRYCTWQDYAEKGYHHIPRRYLISVKTAADMYNWTAEQIMKNPFVVYEWKVKPLVTKILSSVLANLIDPRTKNKTVLPCIPQHTAIPQPSDV
jgi:phytoene synthase